VLKVSINSKATDQIYAAAVYFDIFPNRVQAAQSAAITAVAHEAPAALLKFGRAAKHFEFISQKYGKAGMKLTMIPTRQKGSGPNGYNASIGAAILLTGRRGGTKIRPKRRDALAFRDGTFRGSAGIYKEATVSTIRSKKREISQTMRQLMLRNLSATLKTMGFGAKGGVSANSDISGISRRL
jgi:hypothetical protein